MATRPRLKIQQKSFSKFRRIPAASPLKPTIKYANCNLVNLLRIMITIIISKKKKKWGI